MPENNDISVIVKLSWAYFAFIVGLQKNNFIFQTLGLGCIAALRNSDAEFSSKVQKLFFPLRQGYFPPFMNQLKILLEEFFVAIPPQEYKTPKTMVSRMISNNLEDLWVSPKSTADSTTEKELENLWLNA